MVKNITIPIECRRFRFHDGVIKEIKPLKKVGEYYYQLRKDFLNYSKSFTFYLKRMSNKDIAEDYDCPFCSLTYDSQLNVYRNSSSTYECVDLANIHKQLWEEGLIIIPNLNGWHLINELVIPKDHITDGSLSRTSEHKIIESCLSRWLIHRRKIGEIFHKDSIQNAYQGIVINQQLGQSITHLHYHVYTTLHPLQILNSCWRFQRIGKIKTKPPFEIRISLDDHPELVAISLVNKAELHELDKILYSSIGLMQEICYIFKAIIIQLFGFSIPLSAGWFLLFYPKPYLIYSIVPMKRHGTLQVFQGDLFRKFESKVLISSVKSALTKIHTNLPLVLYQ